MKLRLFAILALSACVTREKEPLGGKWYGGISGDPIVINGVPTSVQEIKTRAQQRRPRGT